MEVARNHWRREMAAGFYTDPQNVNIQLDDTNYLTVRDGVLSFSIALIGDSRINHTLPISRMVFRGQANGWRHFGFKTADNYEGFIDFMPPPEPRVLVNLYKRRPEDGPEGDPDVFLLSDGGIPDEVYTFFDTRFTEEQRHLTLPEARAAAFGARRHLLSIMAPSVDTSSRFRAAGAGAGAGAASRRRRTRKQRR